MNYYKIIFTGIMMAALCDSYTAKSENLLKNPSFELGENKPEHWERWSGKASEAKWSSTQAKSGKKSVSISAAAGKGGCRWISEEGIKVIPDAEYLLTGWIKTKDSKGNASLSIAWYSAKGWMKTSRSLMINKTHKWRQLKLKAKAPAKAVYAKIYVGKIRAGSGDCWFDDLIFEQIGGGSAKDSEKSLDTVVMDWSKNIEKTIKISLKPLKSGTIVNKLFKLNPGGAMSVKALSGVYSIKDTFDFNTGWISQEQKLISGKDYGFQADIFRNKSYNVIAGIIWFGHKNKIIMVSRGKVDIPLNKWQNISISATTPPNAQRARFFIIQGRSSGETKIKNIKQ